MLLERAIGLKEKIAEFQKLKAIGSKAGTFRTRAEQLRSAASLISQARSKLSSFRSAGISVGFVPQNVDSLAEKAEALLEVVRRNPADLTNPEFNIKYEFTDRVSGIAVAASKATSDSWRAHVATRAVGGSEEVLDALSRLPQLRPGVERIRRDRREILSLSETVPQDPGTAVVKIDKFVESEKAGWSELSGEGIPPAVIGFIRACAGQGAPITLLTEQVREWLVARDLLTSFRIRIG